MATAKAKTKPAKKTTTKPAPAKAKAKVPAKPPAKAPAKPAAKPAKPPAKAPAKPAPAKPAKVVAKSVASAPATVEDAKTATSISVSITIREPILPLDRGDRYEDPVYDALDEAGLGTAGDGAGTLQSKAGEIEAVDFDVELTDPAGVDLVVATLEAAGAPKGSRLAYEHGGKAVARTFGVSEAVAIYLDGVGQSDEVYRTTTAQELVDRIAAAAGALGEFRHSWQGPTETALYYYGPDAAALFAAIEPVLRAYPLSRTARVVLRHGGEGPETRQLEPRPAPRTSASASRAKSSARSARARSR